MLIILLEPAKYMGLGRDLQIWLGWSCVTLWLQQIFVNYAAVTLNTFFSVCHQVELSLVLIVF